MGTTSGLIVRDTIKTISHYGTISGSTFKSPGFEFLLFFKQFAFPLVKNNNLFEVEKWNYLFIPNKSSSHNVTGQAILYL